MSLLKVLLYQPIISLLILFYNYLGNMGWSIALSIIAIKLVLLPFTLPSLKATSKMQELAPALAKLKKKYGSNKQKLASAQMELYKTHKINPAAGCLPQIIQIVIIFVLYQVFRDVLLNPDPAQVIEKINSAVYPFLRLPADTILSSKFLYLDLTKPDLIKIAGRSVPGPFLLLSVISQYLAARLMMPQVKKEAKIAKKTETPTDDMASMMQKQSLYIFPFMTLLFGFNFPSGLIISWTTLSLTSLLQQWWLKKGVKK